MCAEALSKSFSIEARQLVNGVDNVVNDTLEGSENLTSKWGEGKTIYCGFPEINRKI